MIRAVILGASGYVGGELMRLIAQHPAMEVGVAFGASNAGQPAASVHPHLALFYPERSFAAWDAAMLKGCDLIFAALPHGETQRLADQLLAPDVPLVDLGADFRLDSAEEFARWYGEPHARPDLLGKFAYGLPEFYRDRIKESKRVAAPPSDMHHGQSKDCNSASAYTSAAYTNRGCFLQQTQTGSLATTLPVRSRAG